MQAIELETTISRLGHIDLPEDCRAAFGRSARIILFLDEPAPPTEDQRRERLRAALDGLATSGAFADIADPVAWQREQRQDRVGANSFALVPPQGE